MDPANAARGSGRDLIIRMLEIALEKAREGQIRSALLITLKPNGADISGEFTEVSDLDVGIKKLGEARSMLKDMLKRSGAVNSTAAR